ncbi:hypothetical protein SFRURICE_017063 [Spodoptera frugiperda]|nr:hypothetical protein SFRURICE_017063 [Spodoptera frugiperda]
MEILHVPTENCTYMQMYLGLFLERKHARKTQNNNLWITQRVATCENGVRYPLRGSRLPSDRTKHVSNFKLWHQSLVDLGGIIKKVMLNTITILLRPLQAQRSLDIIKHRTQLNGFLIRLWTASTGSSPPNQNQTTLGSKSHQTSTNGVQVPLPPQMGPSRSDAQSEAADCLAGLPVLRLEKQE